MASSWSVRDRESFIAYPKLPCKPFFAICESFLLHPLKIYAKDKTMKVNGAKIKEFRESLGLTTTQLAGKIKPNPVTRQAIELWEKKGVTTFKTLTKIAAALEIPPTLLIDKGNGD
jgi:DNA-binding XRE family transcriptional regulator